MSFTFDEALATSKDRVRLAIGDTNSSDVLLSDETIDALLAIQSDETLCSILAVKAILAKLARDTDGSAISITNNRAQVTTHYEALLKRLQSQAGGLAYAHAGGLSRAEIEAIESNEDFIRPKFVQGRDSMDSSSGDDG